MNKQNIEFCNRVFSISRMMPYLEKTEFNEDNAVKLYYNNIMLSESFYPVLSVLEVSLRNAVSKSLEEFFGKEDWYNSMLEDESFEHIHKDIQSALKIAKERKPNRYTSSDVVASFTLGFWTTLFNSKYDKILWKKLRLCFPNLEKSRRVRKTISSNLNLFRNHRNRIFHHEPIYRSMEKNKEVHDMMIEFLSWLDRDLPSWVKEVDRFDETYDKVKCLI